MRDRKRADLPVLRPNLQISFYYRLQSLRARYLQDALKSTVSRLDIRTLDDELAEFVDTPRLARVASFQVRGEVFFAVPCLITTNPFLLGYYRLLLGLSQKEFYNKGPFGRFKRLEEQGDIVEKIAPEIPALCKSLTRTAEMLVDGIDDLSPSVVHDLQMLTLGPQLRGSENTRLGRGATEEVFALIREIVSSYVRETTERTIRVQNDSGRTVLIEFASDPDIQIQEKLPSGMRPLVSIEIKGGADASNVHNRLGEAEKSHQKARNRGFFEFWTIVRVEIDLATAKRESPTTSRLFHLDPIRNAGTAEHREFRELLGSLMGIQT